jgi:hypothetical protein
VLTTPSPLCHALPRTHARTHTTTPHNHHHTYTHTHKAVEFAAEEEAALLGEINQLVGGGGWPPEQKSFVDISISHNGAAHALRVSKSADEATFRDAVSIAVDVPIAGAALHDAEGINVVLSADAMEDGGDYKLIVQCASEVAAAKVKAAAHAAAEEEAAAQAEEAMLRAKRTADAAAASAAGGNDAPDPTTDKRIGAPAVVTSSTAVKARLQRVMFISFATGEERIKAEEALLSAYTHLKGDCIPSYHLLSDEIKGVNPLFNPIKLNKPRLERDQDQYFYEDAHAALADIASKVDYIFYIDSHTRFVKDVLLIDIAADIVAVEHPMYPRDEWGYGARFFG